LYAKARRGELKNFTGIDSAYEVPEKAEIVIRTKDRIQDACVAEIFETIYGYALKTKEAGDVG
jgi:adenylylsulfate kinase-like enzyme